MHFNLALCPEVSVVDTVLPLARNNFLGAANEYIIGADAVPHVTLCQFESEESEISKVWEHFKETRPLLLKFRHFYLKPGSRHHAGMVWAGLAIEASETLSKLQRSACNKLAEMGLKCATSADDYFPHLTLARCNGGPMYSVRDFPPEEFWDAHFIFNISIGLSDINGVYREILYPIGKGR